MLTVTCARAAQHRPSPATVPLLQVQQAVLHRGLHHLHAADATAADTADADADIYPYMFRVSSPITAYLVLLRTHARTHARTHTCTDT